MSRTGFRIREYVLPARYLEGVGVSDEVNDVRLVDNIFLSFSFLRYWYCVRFQTLMRTVHPTEKKNPGGDAIKRREEGEIQGQ